MKNKKNIYLAIIIISGIVIVSILTYLFINKDKMYYDNCLENFEKASYDATIYSCEKTDSKNENCQFFEYQYKNKIEAYKGDNEYYKYINYKTNYGFYKTADNRFIAHAEKNTSKLERINNLLKDATIENVKYNVYTLKVSAKAANEFVSSLKELDNVKLDSASDYNIQLITYENNITNIKLYSNSNKNIRIIFKNINKKKNIEIPTT